jgi:hypothetical protein
VVSPPESVKVMVALVEGSAPSVLAVASTMAVSLSWMVTGEVDGAPSLYPAVSAVISMMRISSHSIIVSSVAITGIVTPD